MNNTTNPLDTLRDRALSVVGPLAPRLLRDRDSRVAVYGLAAIAIALTVTFFAPMFLLAIGPIALGVPHLVADVRYMIARPGLHKRPLVWIFVLGPALAAFAYPHASLSMLAIVGASVVARGSQVSIEKRALTGFAGLALCVACFELGWVADLIIAHAHNVIAVALFVIWSRRKQQQQQEQRKYLLIPAAFAIGLAVIAFGAFDGHAARGLSNSNLIDADEITSTLAPIANQTLALRLVLAFAFAQSVHYAVWVRLVPEQDRERPGLRSFASSFRALCKDLSMPLVLLCMAAAAALAVWAMLSLANARDGYLRLAIFHGPLELGAATLLLLERGFLGVRVKPR